MLNIPLHLTRQIETRSSPFVNFIRSGILKGGLLLLSMVVTIFELLHIKKKTIANEGMKNIHVVSLVSFWSNNLLIKQASRG